MTISPNFFKQSNYAIHPRPGSVITRITDAGRRNSMAKVTGEPAGNTAENNRRLMLVIKPTWAPAQRQRPFELWCPAHERREGIYIYTERENGLRQEMLQDITERNGSEMKLSDVTIPGNIFMAMMPTVCIWWLADKKSRCKTKSHYWRKCFSRRLPLVPD